MRTPTRRLLAAAVALTAAVGLSGCAERAGYDEVKLYYTAGSTQNRAFQQCIPPGKAGPTTINDLTYAIPTTLRTWDIQADGSGDTTTPIDTGTRVGADGRPGPHVQTYATVKFFLNTNCGEGKTGEKDPNSPVVRFFETLGARGWGEKNDKIFTEDGKFNVGAWNAMLKSTVVNAETKALAEGMRFFLADDLEANAHGERGITERRVSPMFQTEMNRSLGGDFFCGPTYRRNTKVTWTERVQTGVDADGAPVIKDEPREGFCPPLEISITDVNFADPKIAEARANVYTAEQEARQKVIAAQAELDRSRILGQAASNEAYIRYQEVQAQLAMAEACKSNSNCTVIVDQTGRSGVQVQQQAKVK